MSTELDQRIRHLLQEVDSAAAPHEVPAPSEVWSRVQFRLAYRPRKETYTWLGSPILIAVYLLAFLMWSTSTAWINLGLIAMLAVSIVSSMLLCVHGARKIRS